jgi:fucose 4-O-acetylase-like acetyltransferase
MNRNAAIDIAKALVIASVVLGHVLETGVLKGSGGGMTESVYLGIYLFHMPFFFLLSGWLFKNPLPVGVFFRKKLLHLMLPYLAWLLVFNLKAMAGFGVNLVRGSLDAEKVQFYLGHFSAQLYGGLEVHGTQMILWFPTCLFFTQQVANWVMLRVPGTTTQVVIVAGCYGLGYVNQYAFPGFHLPLGLNVVAGALPFFFLGH